MELVKFIYLFVRVNPDGSVPNKWTTCHLNHFYKTGSIDNKN